MSKIGFWDDFSLTDGADSELSISTIILIHLYLLTQINFTKGLSTTPIDQDCKILQAHAKYFAIQNCMLKGIPQAMDIYKIIKKTARGGGLERQHSKKSLFYKKIHEENEENYSKNLQVNLGDFEKKIGKKCENITKYLKTELAIIENQKFKNLTKNKGISEYFLVLLFVVMAADVILTTIFCIFILIKTDNREIYMYHFGHISKVGYTFITLFECTGLQIFIYMCLKKKALFEASGHGEQSFKW